MKLPALLFCMITAGCSGSPTPLSTDHSAADEVAPVESRSSGRIAAPEWLPCSPNEVTSFIGMVSEYAHDASGVRITIDTDWDTREDAAVLSSDPVEQMRIEGEPFRKSDWSRIESSTAVARTGLRVRAWVCRDGATILDWQPAEPR